MKRRATQVAACTFFVLALAQTAADALGPQKVPTAPSATLVDDTGALRRFDNLTRGRPVVLGFFFTGCFRICPVQTATMIVVRDELRRRGVAPDTLMLSISVQPGLDTPESVADYAKAFGIALGEKQNWLMLTGRESELAKVWVAFGEDGRSPDEHTGQIWVKRLNGGWLQLAADAAPERIIEAVESGR